MAAGVSYKPVMARQACSDAAVNESGSGSVLEQSNQGQAVVQ